MTKREVQNGKIPHDIFNEPPSWWSALNIRADSNRQPVRYRTEIEIFPHDELGARSAHAQFGKVRRSDAERVHIGRQVPASLPHPHHH